MENEKRTRSHSIRLEERCKLTVSGVSEVLSFEDDSAVLATDLGQLVIQGENLQLKSLAADTGLVSVEGRISAMGYRAEAVGGWLKRHLG